MVRPVPLDPAKGTSPAADLTLRGPGHAMRRGYRLTLLVTGLLVPSRWR
jgi:hypothetical protein